MTSDTCSVCPDVETGEEARDAALDRFEAKPWLQRARAWAHVIARQKGRVNIEDVLEVLPVPAGIHPNIAGGVFRQGFRLVGYVKPTRKSSHASIIGEWVSDDR